MAVSKKVKLAIVGATGHVGREVLKSLDESELLIAEPVLLASEDSQGQMLTCQGLDVDVQTLKDDSFSDVDIALFCTPKDVAKTYIPAAQKSGTTVIDATGFLKENGTAFAAEFFSDAAVKTAKEKGLALPSPLAWSLSLALSKINEANPLSEVIASTYQNVTTKGMGSMEEVAAQSIGLLGGGAQDGHFHSDVFAHQAAFNVLPQVGTFEKDGHTSTENAIEADIKTLAKATYPVSVSCAYVPTFVGDAIDVTLRFKKDTPSADDIRQLFNSPATGIMVLDNTAENDYATPYGSAETSYVYLSRVRADANGIRFWLVADHLRVAVARQMVKLAEKVVHQL